MTCKRTLLLMMLWYFVTFLTVNLMTLEIGGKNQSTRWKLPPNPKSLTTFSHGPGGFGTRRVVRDPWNSTMCMLIMTQSEIQLYFNIFTNLPLLLCSSTTLSRHLYRTDQLRLKIIHDSIFEQNENKILDLFLMDIFLSNFKSYTL